jgi:hypothetical protein
MTLSANFYRAVIVEYSGSRPSPVLKRQIVIRLSPSLQAICLRVKPWARGPLELEFFGRTCLDRTEPVAASSRNVDHDGFGRCHGSSAASLDGTCLAALACSLAVVAAERRGCCALTSGR